MLISGTLLTAISKSSKFVRSFNELTSEMLLCEIYKCFNWVKSFKGVTSDISLCESLNNSRFLSPASGVKSLIAPSEYLIASSSLGISPEEIVRVFKFLQYSRPLIPVSYTHLDVYKRQAVFNPLKLKL